MLLKELSRRITAAVNSGKIEPNIVDGPLGQPAQVVERGRSKYVRCADSDGNTTFGPFLQLDGVNLSDPLTPEQVATIEADFVEVFPPEDEDEKAIRALIPVDLIEVVKDSKRTTTIGLDGKVRIAPKPA
jgi:hypothetical protein